MTLPLDALGQAGLHPGDILHVQVVEPGVLRLARIDHPVDRFAGALTDAYEPGYLDELRAEWD